MKKSKYYEIVGCLFASGNSELAQRILSQPSEEQKKAGNYKKQHRKFEGLDISIENPKGSKRSGTDPDGKEWEQELSHHYGYIKGTKGRDKDHVDVFLNVGAKVGLPVFVVNQVDPKSKKFDEHKIMLGFETKDEAEKGYLANYEKGWSGLGSIIQMNMEDFKKWVFDGKKNEPCEIKILGTTI